MKKNQTDQDDFESQNFEIFDIFTQMTTRLKNFLRGWLLVLGLKEGLVKCATVCVKSEVIPQIREQMLVPDLHVLTLKLHSNLSL